MDKNRAVDFAKKAREKNSIEVDPKNSSRAILSVGEERMAAPDSDREAPWQMVF